MADFDVLVVGGGINGVGIARDLAGRGWRVLLCERDDLAAHTSSASTKLIHGGLRYLEYREFGLVRKALQERERLLRAAPHLIHPLRFVMPHHPQMRPAWLLRLGLFLYDHLAHRELLPGSTGLDLRGHALGAPLQPQFRRGFLYSDGWVDDARLVIANAIDAHERGAEILTRSPCLEARVVQGLWQARLLTPAGERQLSARLLVNATGPWAASFVEQALRDDAGRVPPARRLRLVKGSHIVVPRLYGHDHAYLLQGADGRIVFTIPYQQDFTLVGTTDLELAPQDIAGGRTPGISEAEVAYLCEQVGRYFNRGIGPSEVRWSFAGVRPLLDDDAGTAAAVTRDYALDLDTGAGAPLLHVWGGKLTTYRRLAEESADRITAQLGGGRDAWTAQAPLPGADVSAWVTGAPAGPAALQALQAAVQARHPQLPAPLLRRLCLAYGGRVDRVLGDGRLGLEIAPGLFEAELRHLQREEWAVSAEDVLWRRSKLGLHCSADEAARVERWLHEPA
ncbi:glycerol-3-phosphate dehydrogenase [Pelomonas sp. BJYL3]|uniref:glycerol-3-phosphate dehydrogenase n=1 Tax=Pelomonas sp. BJYL3 TaxID=2976697 RepID=UPI0022B36044|nr:glycerol-3-phosphate dehydrogenase [Pelomonas sp. BJYL3]